MLENIGSLFCGYDTESRSNKSKGKQAHIADKELKSTKYNELLQIQLKNRQRTWIDIFFPQRRYTNGQQVHETVLNISDQGNANQNYNEISPHPVTMAAIEKIRDDKC